MKKILVHSYKGGTAKTTFSVNIAKSLVERGEKVLLIEADYTGAELSEDPIIGQFKPTYGSKFKYFMDFVLENDPQCIKDYIAKPEEHDKSLFDVIFSEPMLDYSWYFNKNIGIINENQYFEKVAINLAKGLSYLIGKYTYVVFDMGPGISKMAATIAFFTDIIVISSRINRSSLYSTFNFLDKYYFGLNSRMRELVQQKDLYVVVNQVPTQSLVSSLNVSVNLVKLTSWVNLLRNPSLKIKQIFQVDLDVAAMIQTIEHGSLLDNSFQLKTQINQMVSNF